VVIPKPLKDSGFFKGPAREGMLIFHFLGKRVLFSENDRLCARRFGSTIRSSASF